MTGPTHQMVALVSALACLTIWPTTAGPIVGTLSLLVVMIGAITPDIDQPTANIWQRFLGGYAVGNIFQFFSGGHRHITHSLLGIVGIGWALRWLIMTIIAPTHLPAAWLLWHAFMIGYISHSVADTMTDRGVPWFWPLHLNIKIPPGPGELRVTTGSIVEMVIVRGGLLVIALLLLSRSWPIVARYFSV
jgi:inner membrane protein